MYLVFCHVIKKYKRRYPENAKITKHSLLKVPKEENNEEQLQTKQMPYMKQLMTNHLKTIQEAHGPRLVHLSKIATADMQMQMLCNIFPILSLQVMKGSSYEQFLVLKNKNVLVFFIIIIILPYIGITVNGA